MARSIRKELEMRGISDDEVLRKCAKANRYSVMREYGFSQTTSWNNFCNQIGAPDIDAFNPHQDGNTTLLDQVITKITRLQNQLDEAQDLLKEKDDTIAFLQAKLETRDDPKMNLIERLCSDVIVETKEYDITDDLLGIPAEI